MCEILFNSYNTYKFTVYITDYLLIRLRLKRLPSNIFAFCLVSIGSLQYRNYIRLSNRYTIMRPQLFTSKTRKYLLWVRFIHNDLLYLIVMVYIDVMRYHFLLRTNGSLCRYMQNHIRTNVTMYSHTRSSTKSLSIWWNLTGDTVNNSGFNSSVFWIWKIVFWCSLQQYAV